MTPAASPIRTAVLVVVLALAAVTARAQDAGKVLFVAGQVTLERTPPVALKQGDAIQARDTIATGEKSRAQILMNDGARVALRANSRYRVDEFGLPASVGAGAQATATRAEGISVATLLKGGFRSSTGAIGKDGAGVYEVRTPIGTLGIRGTDYTAIWCQGDCADVPAAAAARNGMYLATHEGAIVFRYGNREVVLPAGKGVFIAAGDLDGEPFEQLPEWMTADGYGSLLTGEQRGDGKGQAALPDFADRREPPAGQAPADPAPPDPGAGGPEGTQRPIRGTVGGQTPVDLTRGQLDQRVPGTPSVPPPANSTPPATGVPPPPPTTSSAPPPGGN